MLMIRPVATSDNGILTVTAVSLERAVRAADVPDPHHVKLIVNVI